MKRQKKWWIKHRDNPQLGVYYVPMGQMSKTAAMKAEETRYGENTMLPFDTEEAYNAKIAQLKKDGERVQS